MRERTPTYMADFETTTEMQYLIEGKVRVWAWAVEQVDGHQETFRGETLEEFLELFEGKKAYIYFHNMKFDTSYLLDYWMRNGVPWAAMDDKEPPEEYLTSIIDGHGQFYLIKYCNKNTKTELTFKDLYKKYRMPLEGIAQIFGIKGKTPLKFGYRPIGREVTDEEWDRVQGDARIGAVALRYQMVNNLTGLTVASDAMTAYKDYIGQDVYKDRHPNLPYDLDQELRRAYRGGVVQVNPIWKNLDIFNVLVFDINSMYPAAMAGEHGERLPRGMPRQMELSYECAPHEVEILRVKCNLKLKEGALPWVHYKGVFGHTREEFIYDEKQIMDISFTTPELELLKKTYDTPVWQPIKKFVFNSEVGQFKDFIYHYNALKEEATREKNGGKRQQAKDTMNTPSGKFALNPNTKMKIPYFNPEKNKICFEPVEDRRKNLYCPTSAFITAHCRKRIIEDAMKFGSQFVYMDTDSLHILKGDIDPLKVLEVHKTKLGAYKHEATWERARYLRAKAYYHDQGAEAAAYRREQLRLKDAGKPYDTSIYKTTEIKCGGMTDMVKDFVDFENFFTNKIFNGKLIGTFVPGGYLLKETTYKIAEKEIWRL